MVFQRLYCPSQYVTNLRSPTGSDLWVCQSWGPSRCLYYGINSTNYHSLRPSTQSLPVRSYSAVRIMQKRQYHYYVHAVAGRLPLHTLPQGYFTFCSPQTAQNHGEGSWTDTLGHACHCLVLRDDGFINMYISYLSSATGNSKRLDTPATWSEACGAVVCRRGIHTRQAATGVSQAPCCTTAAALIEPVSQRRRLLAWICMEQAHNLCVPPNLAVRGGAAR